MACTCCFIEEFSVEGFTVRSIRSLGLEGDVVHRLASDVLLSSALKQQGMLMSEQEFSLIRVFVEIDESLEAFLNEQLCLQ